MIEENDCSQFYIIIFFAATFLTGTRSIPHFGHTPGLSIITSLCIGQVYFVATGAECFFAVVSFIVCAERPITIIAIERNNVIVFFIVTNLKIINLMMQNYINSSAFTLHYFGKIL